MRQADSDGSGGIDFEEFCEMLELNTVQRNVLVTSSQSSAELWLTSVGFVYCAHDSKVCHEGFFFPQVRPAEAE